MKRQLPRLYKKRKNFHKRLLLINPSRKYNHFIRYLQLPPYALLSVAAEVPSGWTVNIIDETTESVKFNDDYDLVGITSMTHQAPNAYEIADGFRDIGVPVIMGGIHTTVCSNEAIQHADSIIRGEAETILERLLRDFENGEMKPIYEASESIDLSKLKTVNRKLVEGKQYLTLNTVQTVRGCPYDCNFCTVTQFYGKQFRFRPVADIIAEIKNLPGQFIVFVDDNIVSSHHQAKDLFKKMIPLDRRWASQATMSIAEDPELLKLAVKSGCIGLFFGIESIATGKSDFMKLKKIKNIEDSIKKIQDSGILVEGSFIFGFDTDDDGIFERTLKFAMDLNLSIATFQLLTPYPGTEIEKDLSKEGRIISRKWEDYNLENVVFIPKQMSIERLYEGWKMCRKEFYKPSSILKRISAIPHPMRNLAYNIFRAIPNWYL